MKSLVIAILFVVQSVALSAPPQKDFSHLIFNEGRREASSLIQMNDSLTALLQSCGGTLKVTEKNDQVTLTFKNVKSCSNFTLFSFATGEKKNYKLNQQANKQYAGSFTIPKSFMAQGLENLALSIRSNSFVHEDKIRLFGDAPIKGPKCSLAKGNFGGSMTTTVNGVSVGNLIFDLDSAITELNRLQDKEVCRIQRKDCTIEKGNFGATKVQMGEVILSDNNFDVKDAAKKMNKAIASGLCRYRNRPECSIGFGNFGAVQIQMGNEVVGQPIFDIFDVQKKIVELIEMGACVPQEELPLCAIAKGNFGSTHIVLGGKKVGQDFFDIVETTKFLTKLIDAGICGN